MHPVINDDLFLESLNYSLGMVFKTKEENDELKKKTTEYERQLQESSNANGKYSQDAGR